MELRRMNTQSMVRGGAKRISRKKNRFMNDNNSIINRYILVISFTFLLTL